MHISLNCALLISRGELMKYGYRDKVMPAFADMWISKIGIRINKGNDLAVCVRKNMLRPFWLAQTSQRLNPTTRAIPYFSSSPSRPCRAAAFSSTPSVPNYKSFQEFWRVKSFQNLTKIIERNTKIYDIK